MKYLLTAALISTMSLWSFAESLYLHIQKADGNWEVLCLDNVDRLTFQNNQMIASDTEGEEVATFDSADLESLQVNDSADENDVIDYTGVATVNANSEGFIFVDATTVRFNGTDTAGTFEIFDTMGKRVVAIKGYKAGQSVDISAMEHGVYVLKFGNNSKKIAVK